MSTSSARHLTARLVFFAVTNIYPEERPELPLRVVGDYLPRVVQSQRGNTVCPNLVVSEMVTIRGFPCRDPQLRPYSAMTSLIQQSAARNRVFRRRQCSNRL